MYHRAIKQMKKQLEFERQIQIYMHQQQQQKIKVESTTIPEIHDLNGHSVTNYHNFHNHKINRDGRTGENFVDLKTSNGNILKFILNFPENRWQNLICRLQNLDDLQVKNMMKDVARDLFN
ncbi:hypothetical protein L2E82_47428 [Cichorium intybus]|uniref:Uncharacterized protein n=1 Tax=Cichorium intybus TaxID=13427 RepID=A0ACB8YWI2_CICIN|nr:hypothetical protein L2E82_47428 [Cichorium intybus]